MSRKEKPEKLPRFLSHQFTKEERELAAKISNDIAEDINCNETKKQLRVAINFWASYACDLRNLLNIVNCELEAALTHNLKSLHNLTVALNELADD